tara:strand:+ start:709 stop:1077 length:369 start_codon:yes stop_codon:yes gene_type:complete
MANYYTNKASIGHAAQFQASGRPFISAGTIPAGTEIEISFPSVTRSITINKLSSGGFAFAPSAPAANLVRLKGTEPPFTLVLKCRKIYLVNPTVTSQDYEIFAELTGIEEDYELSGSGIDAP